MPNDLDFPKRLLVIALSAAFPGHAIAQSAARVDFVAGNVTASTADGRSRPLTRGAEVRVGETVSTQAGRAQMRFTDGALVSLQPQTEFKVESYVFDGRGSENESAIMSLFKGGLRTITGLIGRTNRDGYRLQTSTATVGIRGTEYSVSYDEGGSVTMFVAGGSIAVINQSGTTVVPGGRSVSVGSTTSTPQTVNERPFLPPSGSNTNAIAVATNVVQEAAPPITALLTGVVPNAGIAEVKNEMNGYPSSWVPNLPETTTSATLNAAGALTSYTSTYTGPNYSYTDTYSSGSAAVQSAGNDGTIAWGGWFGGVAQHSWSQTGMYGSDSGTEDIDLTYRSPWFYVVGTPVPVMPTSGSASYNMIGALAGCPAGMCTSASVIGARLEVDFGQLAGSHATTLLIDGGLDVFRGPITIRSYYYFGGAGLRGNGQSTPSSSFYTNTTYSNASGSSRYFYGDGFFAGTGASRAGMAFTVEGYSYSKGEGGSYGNLVNGVIAYAQASASGASMFSSQTLNTGASSTLVNYPEFAGVYNGDNYLRFSSSQGFQATQVQVYPGGGVYSFEGYGGGYQTFYPVTHGTSTVLGEYNDGVLAWGRWTGGKTSDYFYGSADLAANGPFHYIVGVPAVNVPTSGTATYNMLGATASCASLCGSNVEGGAQVTSSTLVVNFGPSQPSGVNFAMGMNVNGTAFTATEGNLNFSGNRFSTNATLNQAVGGSSGISGSLNVNGQGFLAGNGATHAGMAYSASGYSSASGLMGSVNGVVGYKK